MKEERAMAGTAISFAAGIFLAGIIPSDSIHLLASVSVPGCVLASALLIRYRYSPCLFLAALALGLSVGTGSLILEISSLQDPWGVMDAARKTGAKMQEAIDRIPFESSHTNAVIKAFLTGNRNDMPKDLTEAFRDSGASHILALSGLHLGMLYAILTKALGLMGGGRGGKVIRSLSVMAACTVYTMATGAGASLVRALIFVLIMECGRIFCRKTTLKDILPISMMLQLCLFPEDIHSVGFQLSYAAMAGITYIFPYLKGFWESEGHRKGPLEKVWNSAALSISCQLTTGPLAYFHFHTFPVCFMLTNLIALPLTGMIIPLSIAVSCLSSAGICPEIAIRLTETAVRLLCDALEIIASI